MKKKPEQKKPSRTVSVDTAEFRYALDKIRFRLRNARKELKRRMNTDPLWKV
jgi:hypothetical protein